MDYYFKDLSSQPAFAKSALNLARIEALTIRCAEMCFGAPSLSLCNAMCESSSKEAQANIFSTLSKCHNDALKPWGHSSVAIFIARHCLWKHCTKWWYFWREPRFWSKKYIEFQTRVIVKKFFWAETVEDWPIKQGAKTSEKAKLIN